jgi:hypothetical protein
MLEQLARCLLLPRDSHLTVSLLAQHSLKFLARSSAAFVYAFEDGVVYDWGLLSVIYYMHSMCIYTSSYVRIYPFHLQYKLNRVWMLCASNRNLYQAGLMGTLSPAIGNLTNLSYL